MGPAELQVLFQLGFFGLLILLAVWVKGVINDQNEECKKTTAKLGEELKQAHATTQRIMETTITQSNETRLKQVESFDKLTARLTEIPCMKREK